jgi:hypothetical protein
MESTQRLVKSWMVLGRDDDIETLALGTFTGSLVGQ